MRVELIEYTGKGRPDQKWHAADMLIFTKSTRLGLDSERLEAIKNAGPGWKTEELAYMAKTIPSSWEFADVTFLISGVSRAIAQQITRTRTASYAMQSMRVVDAGDLPVVNPYPDGRQQDDFELAVRAAQSSYRELIASGSTKQDARGVLPLATATNLVAKYNLRDFVRLYHARSSLRTQPEYAAVVKAMYEELIEAWPWAEVFFQPPHEAALELMESVVEELGLDVGHGAGWQIAKAMDLLRKAQ